MDTSENCTKPMGVPIGESVFNQCFIRGLKAKKINDPDSHEPT